ncbi:DNA replication protein DnaC [Marinococcus luteus]|uniref:DNA replication protein DnaC n=2 Tax=Marinococcus luteus TaxID=1122204 RepID=A0A1H2QYZ4_9BACI|nr:DNA replication protein DnaC [Marinococcus luteus]
MKSIPLSAADGSGRETEHQCSICKDRTGWLENVEGVEKWVICPCIRERRTQRLLQFSEITESFRNVTFGQFQTDNVDPQVASMKKAALAYYSNYQDLRKQRENSMLIMGVPGCGKTHILTALSNNLMQRKKIQDENGQQSVSVQYFPYVEGFNDLRDDFTLLERKMKRMKKADVLFIDDLFKPVKQWTKDGYQRIPRATAWQIEQMYAVINHRYLNHLPILVSTELIMEELVDVDDALASRIVQMCKSFLVTITGPKNDLNYRLKGVY